MSLTIDFGREKTNINKRKHCEMTKSQLATNNK